jgi:glycyl-tRNA synthetase beta chain
MAELLLELFSEEIPARMQAGAARDLARLASEKLARAGLEHGRLEAFAGPRRLTLVVENLPERQPDRAEERKGPRVGAPEAAVAGFLRSTGIARDALVERDGVYFASLARAGRPTADLVAEIVRETVAEFPWPKSMTWGEGKLRWVRPLHRILCILDGKVVPLAIDGIESAALTEGHRFMGAGNPLQVSGFEAYRDALRQDFVILEADARKARIIADAHALVAGRGLALVEDAGLLEEVAGMAEWPVALLGCIDPRFLDLPEEVVRTTLRHHQRYFAVRSGEGLAPHFVAVADIESPDGGELITAGNARVLAARLADARFFWDEDRRRPLAERLPALEGVTFHARLGTMAERVRRIVALARAVAERTGTDPDLAGEAARLAKADLTCAMVGEFPELQGIMGAHYARAEGLDAAIADAIADHYKPQGPSEAVPRAPVSVAVALADKMDTILGFFAIGEKPTGSRDPFALRRAALGAIRILLENGLRLPLADLIAASPYSGEGVAAFFAERFKVMLREAGARYDLVDAVFALGDDDLVRVAARIEALAAFLAGDDGANLLAGYKRAGNILNAEARKGPLPDGPAERLEGAPAQEADLIAALGSARPQVAAALEREDFAGALAALAALRAPVDAFFDHVLVNSPDQGERANRLRLLGEVRGAMAEVADFSLVSG